MGLRIPLFTSRSNRTFPNVLHRKYVLVLDGIPSGGTIEHYIRCGRKIVYYNEGREWQLFIFRENTTEWDVENDGSIVLEIPHGQITILPDAG